jgi:hypothetical protein
MRAVNVALALLVSALIGAAVLEGGLRLLGFGPPKTLMQFDPVLGWSKKPDYRLSRSTSEFEVEFEINELGLRDDPMADRTKPAGTFRVVMLGDSFTLGFAVDRHDLFVDQLERWWQAEGRAIDVINAGTEGYSTDQAILWLARQGRDFDPDLVLLFPYDNDLYWNGQTDYMGRAKPRYAPDGTLETDLLENTADTSWKSKLALTKPLQKRPDVSGHYFKPGTRAIEKEHAVLLVHEPEFLAAAKAHTLGGLLALERTAAELGARAIVVPIPSHAAIDEQYAPVFGEQRLGLSRDAWDPHKPIDAMIALARQAGLETLDARAALSAARRGGVELYNQIDWHLNPAGNAAFAGFLHDELDRLDVFPAPHAAPSGAPVALPAVEPERSGPPFWLLLFGGLWVALTALYYGHYRDEPKWQPPLKVAAMLAAVFGIILGGNWLLGLVPAKFARYLLLLFVVGILTFVLYKVGRRAGTIFELLKAFVLRGHWYLMPLIVVLLTVGSLLVVAASSPLVAPFIYTLF